ncbi:MAG: riboflavin synthase subunit beta [Flavobacteriaceae bacterium]
MGIFKTRKNKKFTYEPRYYKSDKEGSPFQIERKFDQFRKATGDSTGLKSKFSNAWDDFRNNSDKKTNKTIFIIITILVLIFLFIIDFDLSIFKKPL